MGRYGRAAAIMASSSSAASATVRASGAGDHQAREVVEAAGRRERAARRLQADQPGRCGGDADGAAAVRARSERQQSRGDGDGRAAARSSCAERRVPRVAGGRCGEDSVYAGSPNSGALVLPRLTAPASSSVSTSSSEVSGTKSAISREPKPARTPARMPQVLVAEREAPERRGAGDLGRDAVSPRERRIRRDRDERAELGVEPVDAVEVVLSEFARRHRPALQFLPECESGQLMEFGHVQRLTRPVQ